MVNRSFSAAPYGGVDIRERPGRMFANVHPNNRKQPPGRPLMPEQWLSYRQLAQHWGISSEASRARAKRGHWQRRTNNAGVAEVLIDTDAPAPEARRARTGGQTPTSGGTSAPDAEAAPQAALAALEAHIATLKDQLVKAEGLAAAERDRMADLTAQLLRITAELMAARTASRPWWRRMAG